MKFDTIPLDMACVCGALMGDHRYRDAACPLPRTYRGLHAGFSDTQVFLLRRGEV